MIYDYVVTVKNERRRSIDMISILVILISAAAFMVASLTGIQYPRLGDSALTDPRALILIVASVLLFAGLGWSIYSSKHSKRVGFNKLMTIAGFTWFVMPFLPWIGLAVLLLSLLEKPAKMHLEIGFTHDKVVINNIIRRKYPWQAFSNVLLKDGILTLDFKNNRIFQKETIDEEGDAEEEEFNEYCLQRLSASAT